MWPNPQFPADIFFNYFFNFNYFLKKVSMIDFRIGSKYVSNYVLDPVAWGAHIILIGFLNDLLQPSLRREGGVLSFTSAILEGNFTNLLKSFNLHLKYFCGTSWRPPWTQDNPE